MNSFSSISPNRKNFSLLLAGLLLLSTFLLTAIPVAAETDIPATATGTTTPDEASETETPTVVATALLPPSATATLSGNFIELLVKLKTTYRRPGDISELNNYGQLVANTVLAQKMGVHVLRIPVERFDLVRNQLASLESVAYTEINQEVYAQEIIPNDPAWPLQYNMAAIRAPQGWQYSTGSSSIIIAVIDSGVDATHPELAGKLVAGYDFVNADFDPADDYGHGTHVAGLAAAIGNNGIGMAGVAWNARVMPLKVLNSGGGGSYANTAAAILWATDQGARVINLSLGGVSPSLVLEEAVNYAADRGVLMVGAAGNTASPWVLYPAAYPAVIAVASTDSANQVSTFSNYGPQVELAAPGTGVYSLSPGGYMVRNGTSMSAPQVSGLAAILLSLPGNGSALAVREQMRTSALDLGAPGWDNRFGFGLIQMDAALLLVVTPTPTPTLTPTPMHPVVTSLPSFGGGYFSSTLTPTFLAPSATPSANPSVAVPTQEISSEPGEGVSPTPTTTPMQLPLLTPSPTPEFESAPGAPTLPCWSAVLLLLAVLMLLLARKMLKANQP